MCYLEVELHLLSPLLHWFGPQVRVPFTRKIRNLNDFPELHEKINKHQSIIIEVEKKTINARFSNL